MQVTRIEDFREHFESNEAFSAFVKHFEKAMKSGSGVFFAENNRLVGGIFGPDATKEYLCSQLKSKLARSPEILAEIAESLESDDIVD